MAVRINLQRLLYSVLTTLVIPLLLALLIDQQFGWFPLSTIGATIVFIPLSTFVVVRAALSEMDQLIQKLAPVDVEPDEASYEKN